MSTSHPGDWVLLNIHAYLGKRRNATTASATTTTRNHQTIEVSLCPARPPLPSNLFVHCPQIQGAATVLPRIVRAAEDLILLRVAIHCQPDYVSSPEDSDYFIYRAHTKREPSLQRLSRPHPFFHDDDVGLLSRGHHYTIAALIATPTLNVFHLHRFHSEIGTWTHTKVSVGEPQQSGFPSLLIPNNCSRLLHHDTSTVIAIGGEGGTMGWVDLWRGILFCDLLRDEPTLRAVPLPLPLDLVSCNNGLGVQLGCPNSRRAIASFIKRGGSNTEDCLKLVHLEANATRLPDNKTGSRSFRMHNWAIVSWSNTKMTSSWKDWHMDCRIQASDITVDSQIESELLQSGLLLKPRDGATAGRAFQNLLVSDPTPDISAAHQDVVYLMAREKFMHPKAWVLALDLRNSTLLGAAEFGTERQPCAYAMYCPSSISKYMNANSCDFDPFLDGVVA